MKILVLGHRGMAGHIIYDYLSTKTNFEVFNADEFLGYKFNSITNLEELENKLHERSVDYIINCIGLLKRQCNENPISAIAINSLLPHQLVRIADEICAHVIHLSTDCYLDDDVYGRSKRAGEINYHNHVTIRTSIIGPEIKRDGDGLFEWFMRQEGEINGYTNVIWDGITTLELAKFISYYIGSDNKLYGIKNLRSNQKISKYDLLELIKVIYSKQIQINKFTKVITNKTEKNDFLEYNIPPYYQMIKELFEYQFS
ncbi:sugar nucleotide-binding protein [Methanomethylovorans sp.]|uniref:sugar nucleotide-binding protein n=1 Tax=Methanomethylovorans sp. TaxID=2758717 RepID=UPI00351BFD82